MRSWARIFVACALAPCSCFLLGEPKADVATPTRYAQHGVVFDHPANWKVTAETTSEPGVEAVTLSVESPGAAIMMIMQFRPAVAVDTDALLAELTAGIRSEADKMLGGAVGVSGATSGTITRTVLGAERTGKTSKFAVTLLGERVPHTGEMIAVELPERTLVLYTQCADEDLAAAQPGFDLVAASLALN